MLTKLNYTVPMDLLQEAINSLPSDDFRHTINEPTGDFFYDPWTVKNEFADSIWGELLSSLPMPVGEARIIILKPGTCYQSHADIDDRYHLNLSSHYAYLVDLDSEQMYQLKNNGAWYLMDAGRLHSATNFGVHNRVQLVVRKLLSHNTLTSPVTVKVYCDTLPADRARFLFDESVSPWLNQANKNGLISSFSPTEKGVTLVVESTSIDSLIKILPKEFKLDR
jgi:hypothetical protein